jgi:hypothetical protein
MKTFGLQTSLSPSLEEFGSILISSRLGEEFAILQNTFPVVVIMKVAQGTFFVT